MGKQIRFPYHIVQHGWNAYLRMINIDYSKTFACPKCQDSPGVIMMGTVRKFSQCLIEYDEDQIYKPIPFIERVFITSTDSRKQLIEYCLTGLSEKPFHTTVTSLEYRELTDYITFSSFNDGGRIIIHPDYPLVRGVIEHFCHQDPITGLFPFSY